MTTTITSDDIGKFVSFTVYPAGYLGSNFTNVKILGIISPATARIFADIDAQHANIYPSLPVGFNQPGKQNTYNYVHVRLQDGQETVLGLPWINMSTYVVLQNLKYVVTLNNVQSGDVSRLRNALLRNGFSNFEIETVALN